MTPTPRSKDPAVTSWRSYSAGPSVIRSASAATLPWRGPSPRHSLVPDRTTPTSLVPAWPSPALGFRVASPAVRGIAQDVVQQARHRRVQHRAVRRVATDPGEHLVSGVGTLPVRLDGRRTGQPGLGVEPL